MKKIVLQIKIIFLLIAFIIPAITYSQHFDAGGYQEGIYGYGGFDSLSINQSQSIALPVGWSIFSSYIDPVYPVLDSVFSDIESNVTLVKDSYGAVYWPIFNLNMIENQTIGEGYQINMDIADTLIVYGVAIVPEQTPVLIPAGWSLIGYLRQSADSVGLMMSPIESEILIMKSGDGAVYWPWFGLDQIEHMFPGQGYQINMNSQQILIYPANNAASSKSAIAKSASEYFGLPGNTGNNMTLGLLLDESKINYGDEIFVYSRSGLVVGRGLVTGRFTAIAIWGDDELTPDIDGLLEGEKFTIRILQGEIDPKIIEWIEGDDKYEINKIAVAAIHQTSAIIGQSFELFQNVPNPFSNETEISFYLPYECWANLEIFDVMGQQLAVPFSGMADGGVETRLALCMQLPPGTYYYRLKTPDFEKTKKMLVLKQ